MKDSYFATHVKNNVYIADQDKRLSAYRRPERLWGTPNLTAWRDTNGKNSLVIRAEKLLPADASWIHWIEYAHMEVKRWLLQQLAEIFPPEPWRFSPPLSILAAISAGGSFPDFDYLKRQASATQQRIDRLIEFIQSAELHIQMPSGTGLPHYLLVPPEAFSLGAEFTPDMPTDMEPIEWAVVLLAGRLIAAANLKKQFPSAENSRKQRRKRTKAARKKNSRKDKCQDIPAESPAGGSLAGDRPLLLKAILAENHSG